MIPTSADDVTITAKERRLQLFIDGETSFAGQGWQRCISRDLTPIKVQSQVHVENPGMDYIMIKAKIPHRHHSGTLLFTRD